MVTTIIFDFGGVILKHKATITQDILCEIFSEHKIEVAALLDENKILLNTGKKTIDDFILEIKDSINSSLTINEIKQKWLELYKKEASDVNWELVDFIGHLKEKYNVYLFTDTIDIHDTYNKTRGIYDKFHTVYKSFEEGIAKVAGKEAYVYILNKIGVRPEECIFIDDLEKNVQIAKDVGIKGIVYENLEKLKKDLVLLGIV